MESRIFPTDYSYFEIKRIIRKLCARYPFLECSSIGKSAAGRDIFSLKIGSENEKALFLGGDDPASPITTLILLKFCEEICRSISKGTELCGLNMRKALFCRSIIVIPLLNPDGAEIRKFCSLATTMAYEPDPRTTKKDYSNWRSNLRGVELKRNFAYGFAARKAAEKLCGIRGPAASGYSGPKSESEAESLAFCNFCRKNEISHLIHLSTFGETVSYSSDKAFANQSLKMAEIISAVSGYNICPPFLEADKYIEDWFTNEFSRPSLLIKVGADDIPKVDDLYEQYSKLKESLALAALF